MRVQKETGTDMFPSERSLSGGLFPDILPMPNQGRKYYAGSGSVTPSPLEKLFLGCKPRLSKVNLVIDPKRARQESARKNLAPAFCIKRTIKGW